MRGRARRRRGGVRRDGRTPRAGAVGDVSGSQVTGGTHLRACVGRIAAAFFAASLVGAPAHAREPRWYVFVDRFTIRRACARAGAAAAALFDGGRNRARLRTHGSRSSIPTGRSRLAAGSPGHSLHGGDDPLALGEPAAGARPVARGAPPRLVRCPGPDVTWPVAPGCLSRPTGLRRRGAPHPGSHSGGTPSFARATDLGLPKTLGRLGKGSVIGFPNPRESSRPAVTTM